MSKFNNRIQGLDRRTFLRRCGALALGSSCALSTLGRLQLAHAQTNIGDDYRALVCVFLFGGNDAFNMLVPRSQSAFDNYASIRGSLAPTREALLPITASSQDDENYGLHPNLPALADLYNQGKLAFVGNIGALVEPTSKIAYENKSVALPPQLFSHNDQQKFVQSLQSTTRRNGWVGRAADILSDVNSNQQLSMNISLSGSNLWQSGASTVPYAVSPQGITKLESYNRNASDSRDLQRVAALENILSQSHSHVFSQSYADLMTRAWDLSDEVSAAVADAPALPSVFSTNPLSQALAMTAQLIAARNQLGVKRQTFFIGMGDFDTHGDQANRYGALMSQLNAGLSEFYSATQDLGLADKITTFTASDFGRTLTSNGDGTDHGWGSHQLVMGDTIEGGDIYGEMPDLTPGSAVDMGEGRIIPTTSVDQFGATLARWYGLDTAHFVDVFPNLANFDSSDLGFVKAES